MRDPRTVDALKGELEGFVDVCGYKLFYRMFGIPRNSRGKVMGLHGGPGVPHQYMLPFTDLTSGGYQVVLYDQLGVGRSELPKNRALFTMERYVEDLEGLRRKLRLGKIHLVGNSCGGQLAIAYALKYSRNLLSLTLIGALADVPFVIQEMDRMKARLPRNTVETLEKHEALGDYDNPEYLKALEIFYRKHLYRLREWLSEVRYSLENVSRPVYHTMNGPNEFTIIGNIRYWDVTDRLGSISVPTLVTCGKYDEVSPRHARSIQEHIRGARLVVFPRSSHPALLGREAGVHEGHAWVLGRGRTKRASTRRRKKRYCYDKPTSVGILPSP